MERSISDLDLLLDLNFSLIQYGAPSQSSLSLIQDGSLSQSSHSVVRWHRGPYLCIQTWRVAYESTAHFGLPYLDHPC